MTVSRNFRVAVTNATGTVYSYPIPVSVVAPSDADADGADGERPVGGWGPVREPRQPRPPPGRRLAVEPPGRRQGHGPPRGHP